MTKYDHVLAMARSEVGIDAANYGDAQIMKKYFQEQVALGKFKMATYVLELVVEQEAVHSSWSSTGAGRRRSGRRGQASRVGPAYATAPHFRCGSGWVLWTYPGDAGVPRPSTRARR